MKTADSYTYNSADPSHTQNYLFPIVERHLRILAARRVFDLGCGNGSVANALSEQFDVVGIDLSESGIAQAKSAYPHLRLEVDSV